MNSMATHLNTCVLRELSPVKAQGYDKFNRSKTMPHYIFERSFSSNRNRSRRLKQIRARTVVLIAAILALATCAWISLVFPSHSDCSHASQRVTSSIFPWMPDDLTDNITRSTTETWHRHSLAVPGDLKLNQILFGIAGAAQLWPRRKEYVKLWWRPGEMRGFVWLEASVNENPNEGLPSVKVSEDISRFTYSNPTGHPSGVRIARIVHEAFRLGLPDVSWFVMGDDDTVFAVENLLQVLRKYDPKELYYIGNPSESHSSNTYFSHGMGFGGGGIAISYALAKVLSSMLDDCLERYPFLFGSDDRLHACISELGVPLTKEPGFHQFDIHGNAFGLLTAHPTAPFISIHHLDEMEPLFPQYTPLEGFRHLTKAMTTEPSNFLQHSVCYDRERKLTFSIASGYAVQVYPYIILPRDAIRPEITFKAWNKKNEGGQFDFDTRPAIKSICDKPFVFYLDNIERQGLNVVSVYKRDKSTDSKKRWSYCFLFSPKRFNMQQIRVVTKPLSQQWFKAPKRQCCKVTHFQDQELGIKVDSCHAGLDRHR